MPERLIVVGGVAAGMSAAAKARRTNQSLEIVVYEQSGYVSYGSCGFPYYIKGEIPRIEDVIVRTPAQFASQGITAHVRHGVQPSAGLGRDAGIALGPTGAVAVDDRQRTSITNIWAAGDVAEAHHLVTGRPAYVPPGTTANKQGKVAGANAAGGDERFGGIVGTAVVKVFDLHVAGTGLSEQRARAEGYAVASVTATAYSRAHYMPGRQDEARRIWSACCG